MRVIVEFNMDERSDRDAHKIYNKAIDYHVFIKDVEKYIINAYKEYGHTNERLIYLMEEHPEVREALAILDSMYHDFKKEMEIYD